MQHGQDAVQELQLARGPDQLLGVAGVVAGVQEQIGVVASLAQVHGSVLQAAGRLVVVMNAALRTYQQLQRCFLWLLCLPAVCLCCI